MPIKNIFKKWNFIISLAFLFIASLFFSSSMLFPLDSVVLEESYLQQCSYLDINVFTILEKGGVPFWSFHFGGGYPFLKHPENISFSPLFYAFVLPFGSSAGMKLLLLFSYLAGITGILLFCRKILRYSAVSSFIVSSFFTFCSFIPFQINTGNTRDRQWFFLPLLLYLLERSVDGFGWLLLCSAAIVLLLFNGFNLYLAPIFLFMFLYALLKDLSRSKKSVRPLRGNMLTLNFIYILLIALFLGAVKIVPVLELLSRNPRSFMEYSAASRGGMDILNFFRALLTPGPYAVGNEAVAGPNGLGMGSVFYFGYIPVVLFVLSVISCPKRIWRHLTLFAVFLLLSMASNSPVDLFYFLWHLPIYSSIHEPARYFSFPMIFSFAVITGAVLNTEYFGRIPAKWKKAVYLICFIGVLNMFRANALYYDFTAKMQMKAPERLWGREDFFSVTRFFGSEKALPEINPLYLWGEERTRELGVGLQYFLLRQNIGLINWFGNITLPEKAVEKYRVIIGYGNYWKDLRSAPFPLNGVFPNDSYRGEAYFNNSPGINRVKNIEWGVNRISVDIDQTTGDVLIINQNHDPEWRTDKGRLIEKNGLLAVLLDIPSDDRVTLTYLPVTLLIGGGVSLVAFLACCFILIRKKRQ